MKKIHMNLYPYLNYRQDIRIDLHYKPNDIFQSGLDVKGMGGFKFSKPVNLLKCGLFLIIGEQASL